MTQHPQLKSRSGYQEQAPQKRVPDRNLMPIQDNRDSLYLRVSQ